MDTLSIRRVPLAEIHPDPANARLHPERNLEAIKASLARFQQVEPLVVQRSTGRLIAGHGRVEAMKALGWTEAEILEVKLDDPQAAALTITLDQVASSRRPGRRESVELRRESGNAVSMKRSV